MELVRCPSCHREESWSDGQVSVRTEGGSRKPTVPAPLAAWRTICKAVDAGQHVVGTCDACGQPLVGPASLPWVAVPVQFTDGEQPVTEALLTAERAARSAELESKHKWRLADINPVQQVMQLSMLSIMMGPVILWVMAVISVIIYLSAFGTGPGLDWQMP